MENKLFKVLIFVFKNFNGFRDSSRKKLWLLKYVFEVNLEYFGEK